MLGMIERVVLVDWDVRRGYWKGVKTGCFYIVAFPVSNACCKHRVQVVLSKKVVPKNDGD